MMNKHTFVFLLLFLLWGMGSCRNGRQLGENRPSGLHVSDQLPVAQVWSGHPVGFALLTSPPHQYIAYYDQDRQLTVAYRHLKQRTWSYQVLSERVGWDSHNYIAIALDQDGHLHVSGNMHSDSLNYFYATRPHDIRSLRRMPGMTGRQEGKTTYPVFFTGPTGALLFTYRDGSSGSGNQLYNSYDAGSKTWRRLLETPLMDGQGQMNAYLKGPQLGPDGYYHLVGVWRDTPDAATNHDLSYARSRDLVHWERSDGSPLQLPITLATAESVDPVPVKGGMINGNTLIGFDARKRPVITYHKYDAQGNIQIYNARREAGGWKIVQATRWTHRWEFGGNGSIQAEVGLRPVQPGPHNTLTMAYQSKGAGDGLLVLDAQTLQPLQQRPFPEKVPAALRQPQSAFAGMQVNFAEDAGAAPGKGSRYILRWETLGRNRDKPRTGTLPPPSELRLYKMLD